MNRFISIKEIESIVNNLLKQKAPGPDGFTGEFYQTLKGQIKPSVYNIFHKISQGILPNSFYEVSITLISKPDKDITRKKNIDQYLS